MKLLVALRVVGLIAFAVAAGVVATSSGPIEAGIPRVDIPSGTSSIEADISSALSGASINEVGADSAPRQQVVNGWAARDLLAGIGRELGSIRENQIEIAKVQEEQLAQADLTQTDERLPILVALLIGAFAWWGSLTSLGELVGHRSTEVVGPPPASVLVATTNGPQPPPLASSPFQDGPE